MGLSPYRGTWGSPRTWVHTANNSRGTSAPTDLQTYCRTGPYYMIDKRLVRSYRYSLLLELAT
jgi:hypothetical protein